MSHNNLLSYAQIHRFHEAVSLTLESKDGSATTYLTEREARDLSKQLLTYAQDIKKHPRFLNSRTTTFCIDNRTEEEKRT